PKRLPVREDCERDCSRRGGFLSASSVLAACLTRCSNSARGSWTSTPCRARSNSVRTRSGGTTTRRSGIGSASAAVFGDTGITGNAPPSWACAEGRLARAASAAGTARTNHRGQERSILGMIGSLETVRKGDRTLQILQTAVIFPARQESCPLFGQSLGLRRPRQ